MSQKYNLFFFLKMNVLLLRDLQATEVRTKFFFKKFHF
jgi:hypothetical protein